MSRSFSKRHIRVRMPRAFIFLREPLGIEFSWIGIVIRIMMKAINWYDHPHAGWQLHFAVWYLVLKRALARKERG